MRTGDSANKSGKPGRMMTEERRRAILALLEQQGRVTVDELTRRFRVSAVTARGDLDALSEAGSVVRSHGGAVPPLNPSQDYPLAVKEPIHHDEKVRIGRAAMHLIKPGQTVIIDSGTTATQLAMHLKRARLQSLTVITHAFNIASRLLDCPWVSLILVGGILRPVSTSCVGPHAEQMIRELHADHFFLSVDGLDPEGGLTTPDILEARLNSLMIRAARETTVMADTSKFGRRSLSLIAGLDAVNRVITDERIRPEMAAAVRDRGPELVVV